MVNRGLGVKIEKIPNFLNEKIIYLIKDMKYSKISKFRNFKNSF